MKNTLDVLERPVDCPQILVSVRDSLEAEIVRASAVDFLDIKEPDNGALGRPDQQNLISILSVENPLDQVTSVAMGEWHELDIDLVRFFHQCDPFKQISFAKFGLSETAHIDWQSHCQRITKRFPPDVDQVVCAYVDHQNANSPAVDELIEWAICKSDLRFILLDTFDKSTGNFFDYVNFNQFQLWKRIANSRGCTIVVAGSIDTASLRKTIDFLPDVVGVRGAVCDASNRNNRITESSLQLFLDGMKAARGQSLA